MVFAAYRHQKKCPEQNVDRYINVVKFTKAYQLTQDACSVLLIQKWTSGLVQNIRQAVQSATPPNQGQAAPF